MMIAGGFASAVIEMCRVLGLNGLSADGMHRSAMCRLTAAQLDAATSSSFSLASAYYQPIAYIPYAF